jgi:hypothetical protein
MKCLIFPVITGATETVTKDLKTKLEIITGKYSVDSVKRELSLEHHTFYGKYCYMQLEP